MGRKNQQDEENEVIRNISCFPTFLSGTTFVPPTKDPPDFVGKADGGGRTIGLELTSWLSREQTTAADGRNRMREDLLTIVDWGRHPRPTNVSSAVIMPQWGKRIPKAHYERFSEEFHAVARDFDKAWKELRNKHWRPMRPDERFCYLAYQSELISYPTLRQYISSICFFERTESTPASNERSWVTFELDGGIYDPIWSIQALRSSIERKVTHFRDQRVKAHLDSQNLQKLYLLVYADPKLFTSNTSWQTGAQLMVSPVEGLADAAKAATEGIRLLPLVFDAIFLFYPVWNSRWLAQVWPTFRRLQEE